MQFVVLAVFIYKKKKNQVIPWVLRETEVLAAPLLTQPPRQTQRTTLRVGPCLSYIKQVLRGAFQKHFWALKSKSS